MAKIKRLPLHVANQIAAGEVVERPASVVKELVENALDAQASVIEIRLHQGGRSLIEVADNGEGLSKEDLELSVMPHATSKIFDQEDLSAIKTLGFRGEALASISAVSRLKIISRPADQDRGWKLSSDFGRGIKIVPAGCPPGTKVQVKDLFAQIPARYKFLKSRQTELSHCLKVIRCFAVCWPGVLFTVRNEKRQIFRSLQGSTGIKILEPLFGEEILSSMTAIMAEGEGISLQGFIASPQEVRLSSRHMYFFLNRRKVASPVLWKAVNEALRGKLVRGNYPAGVIFMDIEPELVDVNVHPSKNEVRFQRPDQVYRLVYHAVKKALSDSWEKTAAYPGEETSALEGEARERQETTAAEVPLPWEASAEKEDEIHSLNSRSGSDKGVSSFPEAESLGGKGEERGLLSSVSPFAPSEGAENFRIIGQFRNTYILAEAGERLLLFDQHAAHEALLFRRIICEFEKEGKIRMQPLMFPHVLNVESSAMEAYEQARGTLRKLGIDVSVFGERQLAVRSVPYLLEGAGEPVEVSEKIIRQLLLNPRRSPLEALRDSVSRIACSMAVKAGSPLQEEQMAALLEDCLREGVKNCPHGRPVFRQITLKELERVFFRQ